MLGGASKKMIDQRLERPIAVTYQLTEFGASALSILDQVRIWSESNQLEA